MISKDLVITRALETIDYRSLDLATISGRAEFDKRVKIALSHAHDPNVNRNLKALLLRWRRFLYDVEFPINIEDLTNTRIE